MPQLSTNKKKAGKITTKILLIIMGACWPMLSVKAEIGLENTFQTSLQHFVRAYPVTEEHTEPVDNKTLEPKTILSAIVLTPGERRKVLLQALARTAGPDKANNILSQYAVKDLDLLSGSTQSPEQSLLKALGQTTTVCGEIMLANLLLTPTTDINLLQQRQAAIQYLLDQPALMLELQTYLQRFADNEDGILSLFDPSDTIYKTVFQILDATTHIGLNPTTSNGREASRRFIEGLNLISVGLMPLVLLHLSWNQIMREGVRNYTPYVVNTLTQHPLKAVVLASLYGFSAYMTQRNLSREMDYYTYVMERSQSPGLALTEARRLWLSLAEHPRFAGVFRSYSGFTTLASNSELRELLRLLQHGQPVNSIMQYYTTHMGRYHKALDMLKQYRYTLLPVLQAVGEIDAWLTITRLVRDGRQRDKNPITFAHYLTNPSSPYLRLAQFWNPQVPSTVAVANSIEMGARQPLNTIITGPNAAGKSTSMEGIAIAVLLAQTFGIAPAQHLEMTPFSLIHTHMDISSEVAAGLSTFKAESVRAIKLMERIDNMTEQQFSLTLMDEIFSSTNPVEGEAGTYGFLKILANNPNAMNICTTHYPRPALLAEQYPDHFQNLHVRADITDGKLNYNYRLKPGHSYQHIAIKILEEEGVQSEFLNIATEIINHPERFPLPGNGE